MEKVWLSFHMMQLLSLVELLLNFVFIFSIDVKLYRHIRMLINNEQCFEDYSLKEFLL